MKILNIESDENFEITIILSLLSRKNVVFHIKTPHEDKIDFMDFLKCVSPDLKYKVSVNTLEFYPGPLIGGKIIYESTHLSCYLKYLILLSPFLQDDILLECKGITNMKESVDMLKIVFYTIFKLFKIPNVEINVKRRGFAPKGEGSVVFKGQINVDLENINITEKEDLVKIRGMVITSRISADYSHRMMKTIKKQLGDLANTKIHCIVNNRNDSGPSPGYECSLTAESRNGLFFCTCSSTSFLYDTPETMALECCKILLRSIKHGGVFDSKILPYIIVYMGLSKGIGSIRIGKLDENLAQILNLMKIFFNVEHSTSKTNNKDVLLTVIGCGYKNLFKPL